MEDVKDLNIYQKLMLVQRDLKVPKKRVNKFSEKPFNYRNAEDILSAAKPVCYEYGCMILLSDKPSMVGNRYYIEAIATFTDGKEFVKTAASARESEARKRFDDAQLTGSASSYARKYALNGLLGLDDNVDPDANDNGKDNVIVCPECGGAVEGFKGKSGKWHSAEQVMQEYGMCLNCVQKRK